MEMKNGRSWMPEIKTKTHIDRQSWTNPLKCQLGLNFLNVKGLNGIKWATSCENLFMPCEQQRFRSDCAFTQSGQHFFVHWFDSIITIVAKPKVSRLSLVSVAEQTGLSLTWSHTTEGRFSRDETQIKLILMSTIILSLLKVSRVLGV